MLEGFGVAVTCSGIFYVFFLFLYKRQDIIRLIQELENYDVFGKPEDIDDINKLYNFYSKLYYIYCTVGASFFFIFNQTFGKNHCQFENAEFSRDEVCGFFMHVWLPFAYNFTPVYEVVAVSSLFCGVYAAPVFTIFFLVFVIVQHLTCKIRHLKTMAQDIFETEDAQEQRERLLNCIRYHQYIIRFLVNYKRRS